MGKITEIRSPTEGLVGFLHEVECETSDSVLIFQLPRETKMLSDSYVQGALETLSKMLPKGKKALVLGADVNVYELAGADAIILRLKGII
jgi:hypothetical protein